MCIFFVVLPCEVNYKGDTDNEGKLVMENSLQNMIASIEYNIEGYKIRGQHCEVAAAERMLDTLKTQARDQAYRQKWQDMYDNDLQDLY